MTINEAISSLDALKTNAYSQEAKIGWLSRLDSMVKRQIVDVHEGAEKVSFDGYTPDTPLDTMLLVPAPYDEVYPRWLEAQIDYHNGEYGRYNNSITLFNTVFQSFARHYTREHMPLSKGKRFII